MPLAIGDDVYVARKTLHLSDDGISPFHRTIIRDRQDRSVKVDLPNGQLSDWVATSKVSDGFGVLIVRIGDYNEDGLLAPLAKAVLHYCRMLLPPDGVRLVELRTEQELTALWAMHHALAKQVVLIGHGAPEGFLFGQTNITPDRLVEIFSAPNPSAKEFISLGCQTGFASFGKRFSEAAFVSDFIAPFHSIHGCAASLFMQTYLNERLLAVASPKVAFNRARNDLLGAASFRLWRNGALSAGQKS